MKCTASPTNRLLAVIVFLAGLPLVIRADVLPLTSSRLLSGPRATIAEYNFTEDLLPSPLVLTFPDNTVTLSLAVGEWRRLDQNVNVSADFDPGTKLLYTNTNNSLAFDGVTTIGGGGSGPVEIAFANGVDVVWFRAQTQVLGPETFTLAAYNGPTLLGTFTVDGVSEQRADDRFATVLGARATGSDCITRLVISSLAFQGGAVFPDDFMIGPLNFRTVRGRRCTTGRGGNGLAFF